MATPAAAATTTAERRFPWLAGRARANRPTFPDLVWAHYRRQQAVLRAGAGEPTEETRRAEAAYRDALREFEAVEGPIVSAYWCVNLPSAVALSARPARGLLRPLDWIGWPRPLNFHRASDWSTQPSPRAAALLHRCDALAVRVAQVLNGTGHQIAMGLLGRSAGNLLSLVDTPSGPGASADLDDALAREDRRLGETERYYRRAAVRQTQLVYVLGMLVGGAALVLLTIGLLRIVGMLTSVGWALEPGVTLNLSQILGVATAGALGAIVSVVRRIDASSFAVDYEIGRLCLIGLGSLRPLMGAVFGLALYAAMVSGLLDLFALPSDPTQRFFFLLAVAFISGFSERFAEDTLIGRTAPEPRPPEKPAPPVTEA